MGVTYSLPGDYTHSMTTVNGCDSLFHLHLDMLENEVLDTMIELQEGDLYNGIPIFNDTLIVSHFVAANGCDSTVQVQISVLMTGVDGGFSDAFELSVFPNPAGAVFYVQLKGMGLPTTNLDIFDALGRRVRFYENIGEGKIAVRGLAAGTYFILAKNENGVAAERVVVK